jgi:hypothetical protein
MSEPARKLTDEVIRGPSGEAPVATDAPRSTEFSLTTDEITARFRATVQEEVARQLAAGNPMYGADEQGRPYALMPDGRRVLLPPWNRRHEHQASEPGEA